jgi:hypothetical protein
VYHIRDKNVYLPFLYILYSPCLSDKKGEGALFTFLKKENLGLDMFLKEMCVIKLFCGGKI